MKKITIKTADLAGAALDWAVAVAEGKDYSTCKDWGNASVNDLGRCSIAHKNWNGAKYFEPSKNWGHGGPIIDRENIGISPPTSRVHRNGGNSPGWGPSGYWSATTWHAGINGKRSIMLHESSALIAAMRCYVESKLGESIDVPMHVVEAAQQTVVASAEDEPWPKRGDLVRYADGATALALHGEPHATGWHGTQCMGGNTFYTKTYRPTEADRWQWVESAIRYRGRTLEEARAEAGIPPGTAHPGATA